MQPKNSPVKPNGSPVKPKDTSPVKPKDSSSVKLKDSVNSTDKTKQTPLNTPHEVLPLYPVPELGISLIFLSTFSLNSHIVLPDSEIALLSPTGLSHEKILALLRSFGEYPPKYRVFIWKSLLGLPGNNSLPLLPLSFSSYITNLPH
jgi:hypothetical protein